MANNTQTKALVNELEKAVDESKKLVKLTDATNELYIEIAKNIKTSFSTIDKSTTKGLSELNKALSNTNTILEKQEKNNEKRIKANDDLEKQEKKLVTLRKKLNDGLSEEAIETEKLNTQIREQNKKRKETVNDSLGLVSAYSKESKALRKMKNELKSNVIEMRKLGKSEEDIARATKATTKEINKLDRELRDLDKSVGDSFREIGKYEEALESLGSTANTVKGALVGVGTELVAGLILESIASNREAQLQLDELQNKAKATAAVVGSAFFDALSSTELDDARQKSFDATQELLSLRSELKFTFNDDEEARLEKEIALATTKNTLLSNEYQTLKLITAEREADTPEASQTISDTIDALDNLTNKTLDVEIANKSLSRSLSEQIEVQQRLKATSEDDNRGLEEGLALKDELAKQDKKVAETQLEIARNEIKIQTLNVGAQLLAKNRITVNEALNITTEQANVLLKDKTNLLALSEETEEAYTQAYIGFVGARTEAEQTALETQEKRTKLLSDKFERDLDFLIDGGDKLKVINEKIIADDTISNEKRQSLLDETKKLTEESFLAQAQVIEDFTHQRIDLDSTTTASQKKALKEKVKASDIESLLAIKDSKELSEKIRQLGLSEIFEGRALEVFKEKIQANADFIESQKDVNKAIRETNEINEDIIDQEEQLEILRNKEINTQEELDEAQEALETERQQNRLDAIEKELEAVEKGSLEEATLNQEKNDILIDQETAAANKRIEIEDKRIKKVADKEKAALEARQKLLEDGVEVIETLLSNSREKQNKELDSEIDSLENRIDDVQNAINNGSSEAAQSLAELEAKKLEAEKQKEELRKKEIRDQKIIAGLQLLASNDGNVGKTLGDVSLLLAALSNLPSFFDGTENTGTVSNPLDSNGGRTVMLHDNERVMTAKQNAKIGGISNEDLADLGAMHKSGKTNGGTTVIQANNQELIQEVKEMTRAVKSIPTQDYNYDANGKYHEQVIQSKNKKERIKTRANNLFK